MRSLSGRLVAGVLLAGAAAAGVWTVTLGTPPFITAMVDRLRPGASATGRPAAARLASEAPAGREPVVGDVNGDGVVTVSCLGDSNTVGINASHTSWCTLLGDMLADSRPAWRVVNHAVNGATAVQARWADASEQLDVALAHDAPDAIIFAFGTNDVTWAGAYANIVHVTPTAAHLEPSVAAIKELYARAEAAGATAFVATTPPANDGLQTRLDYTLYLNNRLRDEIPHQRLIDFFSVIAVPGDFTDALHVNEAGQRKWAAAAAGALRH